HFWKSHQHFSNVLPLGHQPKCCIDPSSWEGTERKRSQGPALHEIGDLAQHLASQRFVTGEHRIHGHDMERGISAKWPKRYARILVDVTFPDLDETPEFSQT